MCVSDADNDAEIDVTAECYDNSGAALLNSQNKNEHTITVLQPTSCHCQRIGSSALPMSTDDKNKITATVDKLFKEGTKQEKTGV